MKNGGKNKSVAFIILFSVYIHIIFKYEGQKVSRMQEFIETGKDRGSRRAAGE